MATPAQAAQREVSSHPSTSEAKSKYSGRLFVFTVLSVLGCALALANIASAASSAGVDQYLEQSPSGGGESGSGSGSGYTTSIGGNDGTVTKSDVKKAAEKNKKSNADDEGASGSTGAAGSGSGTPPSGNPSVTSVTQAAKLGPLDRSTAFLLLGLAAALGGVAFVMRHRTHSQSVGMS